MRLHRALGLDHLQLWSLRSQFPLNPRSSTLLLPVWVFSGESNTEPRLDETLTYLPSLQRLFQIVDVLKKDPVLV